MKTKKQIKELIGAIVYQNNEAIRAQNRKINAGIPVIQDIIDAWSVLGIGELSTCELRKLITNPKDFCKQIKSQIFQEQHAEKFRTIGISESKAMGLIDFPDFDQVIRKVNARRKSGGMYTIGPGYYTLESGKVMVNETAVNNFIRSNSVIIENDTQAELYHILQYLKDAVDQLDSFSRKHHGIGIRPPFGNKINIDGFISIDIDEIKIKPDPFRKLSRKSV